MHGVVERIAPHSPSHRTVLVVDTDKNVRELLAEFLGKAGFHVAFADNGAAALATIKATLPAVVITEILVPKLDGLALCRAVKRDGATRSVWILVLSLLAAGQRASEAGADAFLMKPVEERGLLDIVAQLMCESPSIQELS